MTRNVLILAIAVFCSIPAHAQTCLRDSLKAIAADYFKAVETHDMSAHATAANVRITENASEIRPGEGFFKTGGKAVFQRTIVDRERCSTLTQAVVEETREGKAARALIAVRLRSEGGKVSEIETIIAREGNFAFNPQGVMATADQDWETLMPEGKRLTREQMNRQSNTYKIALIQSVDGPGTKGTGWALDR
jgi:hypothetical protein